MNVFEYAAMEEKVFFEDILKENGYERKTTFYSDLSIGEFVEGIAGIKDTYKRCIDAWKTDKVYMTEFVMALNYKAWEWNHKGNDELSELYSALYYQADEIATSTLKGEDLDYYFETTD